eukprot:GHVR01131556.1.p1 GENE.GHVR01131556.1~~GHVR01131556.1.p1  ORF type:complete len:262 (+),score=11.87 GHVR01131556.1:26-811(+)
MLDKCVATYWVVIVFGILCSVTPQLRCFSLHGRFNALGTGNSQVDNFQAWTVPKCLFWCFYGWGLLYHSIVTLALYTAGARGRGLWLAFVVILHLLRRLLEQLFILNNYSNSSRMHILAFLLGLTFYPFISMNLYVSSLSNVVSRWSLLGKPFECLSCSGGYCILLFLLSSSIQCWTHVILGRAQLQRLKSGCHALLSEGPFTVTSSPHYISEAFIYASLGAYMPSPLMLICVLAVWLNMGLQSYRGGVWEQRLKDHLKAI